MLHVSENKKKISNHDGKSKKIKWNREIKEKIYNIMIEKKQEKEDATTRRNSASDGATEDRKEVERGVLWQAGKKDKGGRRERKGEIGNRGRRDVWKRDGAERKKAMGELFVEHEEVSEKRKRMEDQKTGIGDIEKIRKELAEDYKKTSNN
eukprot:jgi/Antlo1/531/2143